ncbi:MAG: glucokinase [Chloroflexi bacterium]|nr:glucokinase [Chloroflexota bacterium]
MPILLLAGDVGATKTDLAIFSSEAGPRAPLAQSTLPTANYATFESLVGEFLAQARQSVDQAVFAVAGPVIEGRVTATISHLPWELDQNSIQQALDLQVVELINDLEATAQAIPHLQPNDLHTLNTGRPIAKGPIAVIAPGTGLGEAFLIWDGAQYQTCVSEGGHANFAPTNSIEVELLRHVQQSYEHVSYELVCSGMGIPHIYAFLKESGYASEPAWLSEQLAMVQDPTPVIVNAALAPETPCEICTATLNHFISILGAKAGNLALQVVATGGVYLGGGIPPRILPVLEREKERFLNAFWNKGIMTEMLVDVPVHVIVNPQTALLGTACRALL